MSYKNFKKTELVDEIGKELRKERNKSDMTLSHVAGELEKRNIHLSSTMLGRIETGDRRIDDKTFQALCDIYEVNSNSLIVRSCQTHVSALTKENFSSELTSLPEEAANVVSMFLELPPESQEEALTMLRMLTYMHKFKQLNL